MLVLELTKAVVGQDDDVAGVRVPVKERRCEHLIPAVIATPVRGDRPLKRLLGYTEASKSLSRLFRVKRELLRSKTCDRPEQFPA